MARNLTVLICAPNAIKDKNRTYYASGQEKAMALDLASWFAGHIDRATKGQCRVEVHFADPTVALDLTREKNTPTTWTNPQTKKVVPVFHRGAVGEYLRQFDAGQSYFTTALLTPRGYHPETTVNLSWGQDRFIYVNQMAPSDYLTTDRTGVHDVLMHEVFHHIEYFAKKAGITLPSPDQAGKYVVSDLRKGWTDFLDPLWDGKLDVSKVPGVSNLSPTVWRSIPSWTPLLVSGRVSILPFLPAPIPGLTWRSLSYVEPTTVKTQQNRPARPARS